MCGATAEQKRQRSALPLGIRFRGTCNGQDACQPIQSLFRATTQSNSSSPHSPLAFRAHGANQQSRDDAWWWWLVVVTAHLTYAPAYVNMVPPHITSLASKIQQAREPPLLSDAVPPPPRVNGPDAVRSGQGKGLCRPAPRPGGAASGRRWCPRPALVAVPAEYIYMVSWKVLAMTSSCCSRVRRAKWTA